MKLSPSDIQSSLWMRMKEHYEARLKSLREKNDGRLDVETTARVRGRIATCKEILALGDPQAPVESDDT